MLRRQSLTPAKEGDTPKGLLTFVERHDTDLMRDLSDLLAHQDETSQRALKKLKKKRYKVQVVGLSYYNGRLVAKVGDRVKFAVDKGIRVELFAKDVYGRPCTSGPKTVTLGYVSTESRKALPKNLGMVGREGVLTNFNQDGAEVTFYE